jgi:Flp pilus assembly protein TadG
MQHARGARDRVCKSTGAGAMNASKARRRFASRECRQAGVAAVEMGIVLALLVILLMGVWNFGNAIYRYDALAKAARSAVRYLSTVSNPNSAARVAEARSLVVCGQFGADSATCPESIDGIRQVQVEVVLDGAGQFNGTTTGGTPWEVRADLVTVSISGYPFTFSIPFVPLGTIMLGPINATMAGVGP